MDIGAQQIIQDEFSELKSIYFNSAYMGPSPLRAKKLAEQAVSREVDPSFYDYLEWKAIAEGLREKIAKLMNCSADNIAHSTSVSEVISHVANGLKLNSDDVVVSMQGDYPSNVLPWMLSSSQRGFTHTMLPEKCFESVELLEKKLPKNTKAVNLSHVMFNTGHRFDIKKLGQFLKSKNILFIVDGTQAFGGLSLSKEELELVDVYTAASYKWLLGGYGHAFAYFSNQALEMTQRTHANWLASPYTKSTNDLLNYTTSTVPGARKFDRGQTSAMVQMALLEGSLDLFLELGVKNVEDHNKQIVDQFLKDYPKEKYKMITPLEAHGNIICLKASDNDVDSEQLKDRLKKHNVDLSVREGNLRIGFHLFNTPKQVNQLIEAL